MWKNLPDRKWSVRPWSRLIWSLVFRSNVIVRDLKFLDVTNYRVYLIPVIIQLPIQNSVFYFEYFVLVKILIQRIPLKYVYSNTYEYNLSLY